MRALLLLLLSGCSATFVDDRVGTDLGLSDLARNDNPDRAASVPLARGSFEGRAGHSGAGTAELSAGELRFAADFAVSAVPGPVVVVTTRDALGTKIDPATDLDLGPLRATTGAQSYALADTTRRYVFVFCKPFGVEVARALLEDAP